MQNEKADIGTLIREDKLNTFRSQISAVFRFSLPSIISGLVLIVMEYIDSAMVGRLGENPSAAIGLVSSSTWLFGNIIGAAATGFAVQAAHAIGAGNVQKAKDIHRQAIVTVSIFSAFVALIGISISFRLPVWLGADSAISSDATKYFLVMMIFLPVYQMLLLFTHMLQCSGNMIVPSILDALSCVFDVIFNYFLIYPTRIVSLFGLSVRMPGAGLGVLGASLGSMLAVTVETLLLVYFACIRSPLISVKGKGKWKPEKIYLKQAAKIALPIGIEQTAICAALVTSIRIISPLGNASIAANSFAVSTEGFCYMPGFGIAAAATTLVGQSLGAAKRELAKKLAWLTVFVGMLFMSITGLVMYFASPYVFSFLTPVEEIRSLGVSALRIELFAEPLYAASMISAGVFRGAGDTLVPGIMDIASIWGVRITLSILFVSLGMGLNGVWLAMAIELGFRGIVFLLMLIFRKWYKRNVNIGDTADL